MEKLEQRVLELETRYSFLDDLLQRLNEVVVQQQQQIDDQARIAQMLQQRIQELSEGGLGESPEITDEKPPHY